VIAPVDPCAGRGGGRPHGRVPARGRQGCGEDDHISDTARAGALLSASAGLVAEPLPDPSASRGRPVSTTLIVVR
jgi:hypothetical protein